MRKGKKIEVGDVIRLNDRQSLIEFIIDRELNELKFDKMSQWFDYLKEIVKIASPTEAQVDQLAEVKASRDLLVHNSGIVNSIYLDKAGTRARHQIKEKIEISPEYFRESWSLVRTVIDNVAGETIARLTKSSPT
jgi:hypothetical protein